MHLAHTHQRCDRPRGRPVVAREHHDASHTGLAQVLQRAPCIGPNAVRDPQHSDDTIALDHHNRRRAVQLQACERLLRRAIRLVHAKLRE